MEESASMEIQRATASINNEDQNTQKEANISGGNENKNDELVIEIREMFKRPKIQSSTKCRIYKVPHYLRKWNEEAYTPQVISIGPFHHKNEKLKAMEEHKERYFRSFVERNKMKWEDLVDTIREMEESIRGCYKETIDLNSDRFVKMVLVDASFILELFYRHTLQSNPLIGEPRAIDVILDLLLLENQLPFFVIQKLYKLAFPSLSDYSLLELSCRCFRQFNSRFIQVHPNVKIEHFTDLIRTFQLPPPEKLPKRGYAMIDLSYTATQLHDAGVKFADGERESGDWFFGIKFEKGVLKMSTLELTHQTEVVARNIIALEQTCYIEDGYFTDYFIFMDLFMKTRKDMDLLFDKQIFIDHLGDRYAAGNMIKNLNKGILGINMSVDYFDLLEELKRFYDKPWHRLKALLKREYFSTPSHATSTIVTLGVITVLTFIQTICSIMQVRGSS